VTTIRLTEEPMSYRPYGPATPLLFGYDPTRDLPDDHLARLVEQVVEECVRPPARQPGPGQPPFDPRLCVKVLVYGYATGMRSSRRLEQLCVESLPYLFLTRGDTPSYRTLCSVRVEKSELIEAVWVGLFAVASAVGMGRVGRLVIDSTKVRADASPEAVLTAAEYEAVRQELVRVLEEAAEVDAREEREGLPGETRLGQSVPKEQMRDILRRVRKTQRAAGRSAGTAAGAAGAPPAETCVPAPVAEARGAEAAPVAGAEADEPRRRLTRAMRERLAAAIERIALAQEQQEAYLCLTDPDAQMMYGERDRKVRECHSFEVVVDRAAGLLVVGQSSQASHDNERLEELVEAAREQEPEGVHAVDADSGYYQGDALGRLIERGIDTCVPDSNTAGDLHRGRPIGTGQQQARGPGVFEYEAEADRYRCAAGEELRFTQEREHAGQRVKVYRAVADCRACELAPQCLVKATAQHRTLKVGAYAQVLEAARLRFAEPEHQGRYRHRGEAVETVFGFLRGVLGYRRWFLRGKEPVACEARLFKTAYQIRKVHRRWAGAGGAGAVR